MAEGLAGLVATVAIVFALAGAVRLQKAIDRWRTIRRRDRQFRDWQIAQQRRMNRGEVQMAAEQRRQVRR